MKRSPLLRSWLALPLSLLFAACSGETVDDLIADQIDASTLTYKNCGSVDLTLEQCGATPAEPPAELRCFTDGLDQCQPVHVTITQHTVEGDPIVTGYVVVPEEGSCSATVITDTREDQFGAQEITTERCTTFDVVESCVGFAASDCKPL